MTFSTTYTDTTTFTLTHAKHISAKVATDLRRIQRLYGRPSDQEIIDYEEELIALLKAGYVRHVSYGFKRGGAFIEPTLKYTAQDLNGLDAIDDDPGRIRPGANVVGAAFTSFLSYSSSYFALSSGDKAAFESGLPFERSSGVEPGVTGYLNADRNYSAGGQGLQRASVRSY